RLHIQLTYKRPFEPLLPHLPQRSSERFLIRQIYSCLVSSDANGHVHPELAHHYERLIRVADKNVHCQVCGS
ncbi:hypothetical protein QBX67_28150, partial [Bacillus sp. LS15-K4]|nr:hypothetical protein [Bacillus sp. LS15-K4]